MIQLAKLPASEAERLAYAEGFVGAAELFGRIAELEHVAGALLYALDEYYRLENPPLGDEVDEAIGNLRMVL